jgi:hypothetical protein
MAAGLCILALFGASTVLATGANFTASTSNDGDTFAAAPDFVAPWVSLTDPGANLRGTITLDALATDTGSGVSSVKFQRSPAGASTWTDICTDSSSPYSCSFDTTAVADGLYDLRAVATDNGANSDTSIVGSRRIDNTAPTSVTITNPGTPLTGTITFSGGASDAGSGVASLAFQYKLTTDSTWTTACSDATSPYSCAFDTSTIADGLYDVRSLATDNAGNTTASATTTNRRVDNNAPTVTLNDPGAYLANTVTLTATAADGNGTGVTSVAFQRSAAGANSWTTICTDNVAPYTCAFDTNGVSDGQYDLRAVATDGAALAATSLRANIWIDNTNPATSVMTNPGANLSGTVTLGATATDAGSGIEQVTIQYTPAGGSTWTDVCADTTSPYNCSLDTTTMADGLYDLRAVATDRAGNVRNSAKVVNRRVDNTAPATTMTDPGPYLRGTVTLGATGTDAGGSGVASVTIQRSPAGASSWTDVCTDSTSPYSCSLNTTTLTDGLYDLRTTTVDNAGNSTTSTVVTNRRVDNTAPAGVTMVDPGTPLSGTVTLSGNGSDSGSGMASLKLQYKLSASGTWIDACTDATSPYSCSLNTTAIADGTYDFRSLATDNAGNTATSTPYTGRSVNNGGPAVSVIDPGNVHGTVTISATATDGNGVDHVTIQGSPAGAGAWGDICTDTTAPYSCTVNTTLYPDGQYDIRAIAVDSLGSSSTSAVIAGRWLDNTAPTVTMTDPGAYLRSVVTLQSTPADGGSGIASVLYQRSPAGAGTWTTACTGATTPFSCSFNTTTVSDGSYDFRAVATDLAGNQTTSAVHAGKTIDNTAPAATDIQATNGGATTNRPDAGDTLVLTSTETLNPQSLLAGWNGTLLSGVSVRIVNSGNTDEFELWSGGTKFELGLIELRDNFVTAGYMAFNASSISQSGSTITITLGGTAVANGGATWASAPGNARMRWTPSALSTDLAGNPASTTRVTESGTNDADF